VSVHSELSLQANSVTSQQIPASYLTDISRSLWRAVASPGYSLRGHKTARP